MTYDNELEELLRLTHEPLPLRGDREDSLLDELLDDLEKGTLGSRPEPTVLQPHIPERDGGDAPVVPIDFAPPADASPQRSRLALAAVSIAAAVALFVVAAFLLEDEPDTTETTDSPVATTTIVTTTTTPAPLLTVEEACANFAAVAPDRISLRTAVTNRSGDPADLDIVISGLETVIVELGRRGDIDERTLTDLRLARGSFIQVRADVTAGLSGDQAFGAGEDRLRLLQADDPRFGDCWRF